MANMFLAVFVWWWKSGKLKALHDTRWGIWIKGAVHGSLLLANKTFFTYLYLSTFWEVIFKKKIIGCRERKKEGKVSAKINLSEAKLAIYFQKVSCKWTQLQMKQQAKLTNAIYCETFWVCRIRCFCNSLSNILSCTTCRINVFNLLSNWVIK